MKKRPIQNISINFKAFQTPKDATIFKGSWSIWQKGVYDLFSMACLDKDSSANSQNLRPKVGEHFFCFAALLIGAKNTPATLHREVAILKMNRIELLLSYIRKFVDSSAKKSLIDFTFD